MIRTDKLRGIISEKGFSQAKVAEAIGITPKTFYEKMSKGVFGSDEIEVMIKILHIDNPVEIFLHRSNLISYIRKKGGKIVHSVKSEAKDEEIKRNLTEDRFNRFFLQGEYIKRRKKPCIYRKQRAIFLKERCRQMLSESHVEDR